MAKQEKVKDPVEEYANDVLAGRIIASRWVKLACQRHLNDTKRKDLVWILYLCKPCKRLKEKKYNTENPCPHSALYAIQFFEHVLRLSGGEFEGKPFILEPWKVFIVGSLFGWRLPNGRRRFQIAYSEIGKGSGKSPLAAGIGHFGLIADREPRAEIYAAATKKDQAMILFRDAVAMRDQSPRLAARLLKSGLGEKTWNLADHETGSWFRPISSDQDSQSGPRPHFALVDEVHEHKTSIVIDMLLAGFKSRRNPLMFLITNSGSDRETVCWRYHDYVTRILRGTAENDRIFGFIACLDSCETHWNDGHEQPVDNCPDCDDWRTEGDHWQKANPSLETIPGREYLRAQVQEALDMPAQENITRRLNFGYWTSQNSRWLSMDVWDLCAKRIDFDKLRGRSCIMGLDLSVDKDITALVLLFPPDHIPTQAINADKPDPEEEEPRPVNYMFIDFDALKDDFIVLPFMFIPKGTILEAERRDQVPYSTWVRQGYLYETEGNTVDYSAVRRKLVQLNDLYPVKTIYDRKELVTYHMIGFDKYNAREFYNAMNRSYGINMTEVQQSFSILSEPTKQFARLLKAGKINHGGHPMLRWMADNVVIKSNANEDIMLDKRAAKKRIDGIPALMNAFSLAIRMPQTQYSIYEQRARAGDGPIVRSV